jgi:uncharacterized protein
MKLQFNVDKLPLEGSRYNIVLNKDDVDITEDINDIKANIFIKKSGNVYKSKVFVEYDINLECSRCLEIYTQHQKGEFECEFKEKSEYRVDEDRIDEEDNECLIVNKIIDFEPLLRDLIILSIPMKPLCSPDCKGLCPICGKSLNKGKCEHLKSKKITLTY